MNKHKVFGFILLMMFLFASFISFLLWNTAGTVSQTIPVRFKRIDDKETITVPVDTQNASDDRNRAVVEDYKTTRSALDNNTK